MKKLLILFLVLLSCSKDEADPETFGLVTVNIRVNREGLSNAYVPHANMQISSVSGQVSFFDFRILPNRAYIFLDKEDITISGAPAYMDIQTYVSNPRGLMGVRVTVTAPENNRTVNLVVSGSPQPIFETLSPTLHNLKPLGK